jgi:type VI secretion system protein ImpE
MSAIEPFHDGKLTDAVEAQFQQVKSNPTDPGRRLFLAELLAFSGDLDRARRQLDAIAPTEPRVVAALTELRNLLNAQSARAKLFHDGEPPALFGETQPEQISLRLAALDRIRAGFPAEAAALLAQAAEATPDLPGTLDGRPFTRLRDTDDRLAGVLEVFALGRYYWVPLENVAGLAMNPPKFPRDLLFIPTRLELAEETGEVHLPALYPDSHAEPDDRFRLGRLTEWRAAGDGGPAVGIGAKVFQLDDQDVALIDFRQLARIEVPAASPE